MAFLTLSIAALHRLGRWFPLESLLDSGGPLEPALATTVRLIGLGIGYWLAASTVVYLIGRAARMPAAVRAISWATIGPVRRLVDGIVAGALVVTVGLPAHAGTMIEPSYVPIPAGDRASSDPATTENATPGIGLWPPRPKAENPTNPPNPLPPPMNPQTAGPDVIDADSVAATEIVVRPGDHMWALAEQRLSAVRGRAVSDPEIALYWTEVIGINLPRIRSGDPDLIFAGEVLLLPAIDP
jgi:hypothetical protein